MTCILGLHLKTFSFTVWYNVRIMTLPKDYKLLFIRREMGQTNFTGNVKCVWLLRKWCIMKQFFSYLALYDWNGPCFTVHVSQSMFNVYVSLSMFHGTFFTIHVSQSMLHGPCFTVHASQSVLHSPCFMSMFHGTWFMVNASQSMFHVYVSLYMLHGPCFTFHDWHSMLHGPDASQYMRHGPWFTSMFHGSWFTVYVHGPCFTVHTSTTIKWVCLLFTYVIVYGPFINNGQSPIMESKSTYFKAAAEVILSW